MQADKEPTKRVLLDVNVCIDLITNRLISVETKKRLFHSFINQKTDVFLFDAADKDIISMGRAGGKNVCNCQLREYQ